MKTTKKGFTLVELIIVIAVIGVLAAILIPVFSNVIDKANEKSAYSDAKNTVTKMITAMTDAGMELGDTVLYAAKGGKTYAFAYQKEKGQVISAGVVCDTVDIGGAKQVLRDDARIIIPSGQQADVTAANTEAIMALARAMGIDVQGLSEEQILAAIIREFGFDPDTFTMEWGMTVSPTFSDPEANNGVAATVNGVAFDNAITAITTVAENGGTVKLFEDVENSNCITFTKKATLDLNGHTYTSKNATYAFLLTGVKSNAEDGVTIKNGKISASVSTYGILIADSTLNLNKVEITAKTYGIRSESASKLYLANGSKVSALNYGILVYSGNAFTDIKDSYVTANYAIYLNSRSTLNVYGRSVITAEPKDSADTCQNYAIDVTVKNNTTANLKCYINIYDQAKVIAPKATGYGVVLISETTKYDDIICNIYDNAYVAATNYAVSGNGANKSNANVNVYGNAKLEGIDIPIVVSGTTYMSGSTALYQPGPGKVTIKENATLEGYREGIEMRAGDLEILGGTIKATYVPTEAESNGNGASIAGAAVGVSQHNTSLPITVNISGGVLKGYTAFYEENTQNHTDEDLAKIEITVSGNATFEAIRGGTNAIYLTDYDKFGKLEINLSNCTIIGNAYYAAA